MQFTFRTKLLVGQLALVGVVMVVVATSLDRSVSADLRQQLDHRLEQQARGAALWMQQNRHPEKLANRLADVLAADVTIYDEEGALLASSDEEVAGGADRSDLDQARAEGIGMGQASDGSFRHVAVRADNGIIRLSAPLASIEQTVAGVRSRLVYASLLGVLAAIGLSLLGSALAARPLRKMKLAAEGIAKGDYDLELPPKTPDDFGGLSQALEILAAQLRRDMARIEQLERVRRDFIANVSHELRTPVTAIQGCAETLLDGESDRETQKEFLTTIQRHGARLGVLVSRILQLSALEARAPEDVVAEPVDVREIAKHAVRAAEARAGRALRFEMDFPKALLASADPMGVEQVIDNLIDNAIKYGAEGGLVRIEGHAEGDQVVIAVMDHGEGIPAEHLPRVFERFYRVDKARSRDVGGTGLGLAIVRHLCEAMGGSVDVASEHGKGTRFTVTLPSARPSAVEDAA